MFILFANMFSMNNNDVVKKAFVRIAKQNFNFRNTYNREVLKCVTRDFIEFFAKRIDFVLRTRKRSLSLINTIKCNDFEILTIYLFLFNTYKSNFSLKI